VGEALPQGLPEQAARGDGVLAGNVRAVYLREGGEAGPAQGTCAHHISIGFESLTVKHLSVPFLPWLYKSLHNLILRGLEAHQNVSFLLWYGII
jgi:hypothetical protein